MNNISNNNSIFTNKSFAIASGKGGTGKSIITASIGAILAKLGFKVLIIDTDIFTAGISFYLLGSNPRRVAVALQDVFLQNKSIENLNIFSFSFFDFCDPEFLILRYSHFSYYIHFITFLFIYFISFSHSKKNFRWILLFNLILFTVKLR